MLLCAICDDCDAMNRDDCDAIYRDDCDAMYRDAVLNDGAVRMWLLQAYCRPIELYVGSSKIAQSITDMVKSASV